MAVTANIYIDQGSDYSALVTVVNSSGVPVNLTGYQVESQIRKFHGSSAAYCFNATIADAEAGKVRLRLSSDESQAMDAGRWLYDVRIISTSGLKKRVIEGLVTIVPQATKESCP